MLHEIDKLDIIKESRQPTPIEVQQEQVLREKLWETIKHEEIYWKQRSRLLWLREGDENTKFFHATVNGRKNRNFINSLRLEGLEFTTPREIGKLFTDRLHQQFGSWMTSRYKIDLQALMEHKSPVDLTPLEGAVSLEEVTEAVFDLDGDNASVQMDFRSNYLNSFVILLNWISYIFVKISLKGERILKGLTGQALPSFPKW